MNAVPRGTPYRLDDWSAELDPRTSAELFGALGEWLGDECPVLDVGTGSGYVAAALIAQGVPVFAVDVVDWRASDVRDLPFALGDACALPVADERCAGVHMARMLGYVADWRLALAEMVRVLRPGGTLCLSLGGWFSEGPLRDVERVLYAEAESRGVRRAEVGAGPAGPEDADTELALLGLTAPGHLRVSGSLMRSPRQVVADVVGRIDRWEPGQDLSVLYDIGGVVLGGLDLDLDESLPQQRTVAYRIYRKLP